ncbi:hypothetical protein QAD02_006466 [Eretmocerus hayati]|uniref:Uncharacterized protein n=1 Tax=Eretmocerus hayati TaxID=131215 RepID=A0ACC2N3A4_9HYME|nr:hypothetical protein QAD02_006466 [Eretmocerus hayati]
MANVHNEWEQINKSRGFPETVALKTLGEELWYSIISCSFLDTKYGRRLKLRIKDPHSGEEKFVFAPKGTSAQLSRNEEYYTTKFNLGKTLLHFVPFKSYNTIEFKDVHQESIQHEKKAARKRRRMELKDLSENYDLLLRSDDEIEQSFTPPEPILPSGQVLIMKPDIQEMKSVERYFELCKKEYILRINTAGDEGEPFSITISSDRKMIRLSNNQWLEIIVIYQTMMSEIKKTRWRLQADRDWKC